MNCEKDPNIILRDNGYAAKALNEAENAEALEWCENLISDVCELDNPMHTCPHPPASAN